MGFGLTILLKCYTDAEYTMVSTMLRDVAFKILGILMLYFNLGHAKDSKDEYEYIKAKNYEAARHAAGWAGMLFATCSAIDAAIRPKYTKVRVFDEISITCLYVVVWALFYSMFEGISILFMVVCGFSTLVGVFNILHKKCLGQQVNEAIPHETVTSMLEAMKNEPNFSQALLAVGLTLAVTEPENPNTIALLKVLKSKNSSAATMH